MSPSSLRSRNLNWMLAFIIGQLSNGKEQRTSKYRNNLENYIFSWKTVVSKLLIQLGFRAIFHNDWQQWWKNFFVISVICSMRHFQLGISQLDMFDSFFVVFKLEGAKTDIDGNACLGDTVWRQEYVVEVQKHTSYHETFLPLLVFKMGIKGCFQCWYPKIVALFDNTDFVIRNFGWWFN